MPNFLKYTIQCLHFHLVESIQMESVFYALRKENDCGR